MRGSQLLLGLIFAASLVGCSVVAGGKSGRSPERQELSSAPLANSFLPVKMKPVRLHDELEGEADGVQALW